MVNCFLLYCIVLYLQPVLNPRSYDGARVLEASGRPILLPITLDLLASGIAKDLYKFLPRHRLILHASNELKKTKKKKRGSLTSLCLFHRK